jgi:hypothetical protein
MDLSSKPPLKRRMNGETLLDFQDMHQLVSTKVLFPESDKRFKFRKTPHPNNILNNDTSNWRVR